jgi:toxin ParE1/3/4
MAYRVKVTGGAQRDLIDISERIVVDGSVAAARWFSRLEAAIDTLERFPRRCPVAPESKKSNRELRHLLYGSKRDVYRVIYDIDEPQKLVRVRAVRHSAMDEFKT